jgi:hypothetical protein
MAESARQNVREVARAIVTAPAVAIARHRVIVSKAPDHVGRELAKRLDAEPARVVAEAVAVENK